MKNPFRFQGSIAAVPYLMASLAIVATEYIALDLIYASDDHSALGAGNLTYWFPVSMFGLGRIFQPGGVLDYWRLMATLGCVAAAWALLALAIRRARTVNCSSLVACLAIVPVIQIPTILWLGFSTLEDYTPAAGNRVPLVVALKGLFAGLLLTVALVAASTLVFHAYGFGLFVASPFFVGCVTAYIGNRYADIGGRATIRLVLGACFLGGVGLLAVAIEGIICLVLASPVIAVMAVVGGVIGRAIALKVPGAGHRAAVSFAVLPLSFVIDLAMPPNYSFESVESVEVATSSQQVWDAVVHMGPIPAPPPAPFRWGLAYPMSGTITGSGVGAIREGVFSTGVAYERVTEWQPGSKLSFIVLSDPPTMRELSPYETVHAPHVNGYFRTRDARFTITPLANGHTRLSLATHHELDLSPAFYWSPMAKWAVHTNKVRVLAHFAQQAESSAQSGIGTSANSSDVLDEVLVSGTRLRELKAATEDAEDRFYERYNELNKVDDFDIECRVEAPLGTKIPRQLCLTKLQLKAKTEYGREYLQSLQEMRSGYEGTGKPPDTNPTAVWASRYEEYRANMLSLLNKNPELRHLAGEGEAARKRFDAEYKRRLKGRLILVE